MTELLPNHIGGRWVAGRGAGTSLVDPVLGIELVRADSTGLDLTAGFAYARKRGGSALRSLRFRERGALLSAVVGVLKAGRGRYYEIAMANCGTVKSDSAIDIEGSIYTLSTYAKLGADLGDALVLFDGEATSLTKDESFGSRHVQVPTRGLALFINAFNFPAWGLWEKAAPALLSGVPVVIKPATATAWLTQQMVKDVVDAGVLPPGALSVICGSPAGLLDALAPFDVISFTGSARTATAIRAHPAVAERFVRVNVEADSVNSALLMPEEDADGAAFELLVQEVARDVTIKSGQRCTAIRRVFVPSERYDAAAQAIAARLAQITVGNPRNEAVRMGALVNRSQLDNVHSGLSHLRAQTDVLYDGASHALVDVDPEIACCVGPTLLGARDADGAERVHDTEVFGPVATVVPYADGEHALALVRRGEGSLVVSLYGSNARALADTALELCDSHGRVHVVSPEVAASHTGHGNVMPQSLHGGPGRAGGGEELGGLRALGFYHRRAAVQAAGSVLAELASPRGDARPVGQAAAGGERQ